MNGRFSAIHTAAMEMLGGKEAARQCRKPEICADAAYAILTKDSKTTTGNFFIDEEVKIVSFVGLPFNKRDGLGSKSSRGKGLDSIRLRSCKRQQLDARLLFGR